MDINPNINKINITAIIYLKQNKNQKERRVTIGKPHHTAEGFIS